MDHFSYQNNEAFCDSVPLKRIADEVGTPCYVYSRATLVAHCRSLSEPFAKYPTLLAFAVKANSNLSVLGEIFRKGFGADVVSIGELERAIAAGCPADRVVFSGVGKTREEIARGLELGILSFNVESSGEVARIQQEAKRAGKIARISLRVNPNIDAKTNPHIATGLYTTKFGITEQEVDGLLDQISEMPEVKLVGLGCHIGSQITQMGPFREAAASMVALAKRVMERGFKLELLDLGGGLGVTYSSETPPSPADYANALIEAVKPTGLKLVIEPGRSLVGNAGVLLTRVIGTKKTPQKSFLIVDGAMNDLLRPSLYSAYHDILPVQQSDGPTEKVDVVGPICETGDFLGKDRTLPVMKEDDLVFVRTCGAYAATMASNYNTRPRAPEILVSGDDFQVVRPREALESLWESER